MQYKYGMHTQVDICSTCVWYACQDFSRNKLSGISKNKKEKYVCTRKTCFPISFICKSYSTAHG